MQNFSHTATNTESIRPFLWPPWWTPKTQILIEASKKEVISTHDKILEKASQNAQMVIYTDGSGIQGKIGSATFEPASKETVQKHLGLDIYYNVFAAETLALATAAESLNAKQSIIFTDSQATIKAINNPGQQSGQAIIKQYLDSIDYNTNPTQTIKVIWISGHEGIEGNEEADKGAKNAAPNPPPKQNLHHTHHPMKSAISRHIKEKAKAQWLEEWRKGTKTAANLQRLMRQRGAKIGPKLYNNMVMKNAAQPVQLRTGHCRLNNYLHRYGHSQTSYCECGVGKETVEHYLMECRKYKKERRNMQQEIKKKTGKWRISMIKLLGDPEIIKFTMKFIKETGRIEQI